MKSLLFSLILAIVTLFTRVNAKRQQPDQIYGVNIGNWLVFEPWMAEQEWKNMGGQSCSDCSTCIRSEWALNKAFPTTADALFQKHWETWFTQEDVNQLRDLGINTVRIPLGFWIVEALVDRATEFYARGGLLQLKRGLRMLHQAGIQVVLDHHALPGVSSSQQMFAGNCTRDVQFYTEPNYARALTWTAVMTALIHLEQDFQAVFALEAINEPLSNSDNTPGLENFYAHFSQVVRVVELTLGIIGDSDDQLPGFFDLRATGNLQLTINEMSNNIGLDAEVQAALTSALEILVDLASLPGLDLPLLFEPLDRDPLTLNFMDYLWQYAGDSPANGAEVAIGPQAYDDHLYYSFGGVADPNEEAYLKHLCNLQRVQQDSDVNNSPMWFGEWSLATQFNASDAFLQKWADAQKLMYSKGAGWLFWNFKLEQSELEGDALPRQWSYFEGVARGYLTRDPAQFHNSGVCDQYFNVTTGGL